MEITIASEMPLIFQHLKWAYQKFHLNYTLPFVILVSYTLIGAAIFRNLELERDQMERETFRISYDYAMNQVESCLKLFLFHLKNFIPELISLTIFSAKTAQQNTIWHRA